MSNVNPIFSGEKLPQRWGEKLPAARMRLNELSLGVQNVRNSLPTQESNMHRSRLKASQIIDRFIPTTPKPTTETSDIEDKRVAVTNAANRSNGEGQQDYINFEYVPESPVRDRQTVQEAIRASENIEYLEGAYQKLDKIYGEQGVK